MSGIQDVRPQRRSSRLYACWLFSFRPFAIIAVFALTACAASPPPASLLTPPSASVAAYRIGPGDVLSISVFGAPALSVKTLPVRPDGRISTPLAPDVLAAGNTPTELGKKIAARLGKYVKNPQVSVMVDKSKGLLDRSIAIIGQAVTPKTIPYVDGMTLLDVMVAVKGLTPYAAGNNARVIRVENGKEVVIPVRIGALLNRGDMAQNIAMRPGDVVVIPESWF